MGKKVGITLKSVKSPKIAAANLVEEFSNSEFLNDFYARRWLKNRLEKMIEERDALILVDVNDSIGGTSC